MQNVSRYGKKIWLTEFAKCCTHDEDEIMDFVKEIIPRLEEADYIYRYSWLEFDNFDIDVTNQNASYSEKKTLLGQVIMLT